MKYTCSNERKSMSLYINRMLSNNDAWIIQSHQ